MQRRYMSYATVHKMKCLRNHLLRDFGDAVIEGARDDVFKELELKSV